MELEKFILDNINKILEYFDQDIITIYVKRTVDAYVAGYYLAEKFGNTAQVKILDWPPESGICIGFKCNGLYLHENEVGIDDATLELPSPTPLSYLAFKLAKSISSIDKNEALKLYIGIYSWLVDNCDIRCEEPMDIISEIGAVRKFSLPFSNKPLGEALANSTLPILPGVIGRGIKESKTLEEVGERILDILDEVLGAVYDAGFMPAIADKAIRYVPPEVDIATRAQEIELIVANAIDDIKNHIKYIVELLEQQKNNIIQTNNVFYAIKLGGYLAYSTKIKGVVVLRADVGRGFAASVVFPYKERQKVQTLLEKAKSLGQTTAYSWGFLIYLPRDKWPDLLELIK